MQLLIKKRSGRPRKIKGNKLKSLIATINHHPETASEKIAHKFNCSGRTIRNTLKKSRFVKKLPCKITGLSKEQQLERVEWAKLHLNDDWENTIFCDESSMQLQANTIKFWVRKGKRVYKTYPKNRKKLMFWGAFCSKTKFPLYFIEKKMDSKLYCTILRKNLLPLARQQFDNDFNILQDNDPKHNSEYTTNWMDTNVLNIVQIPPYSPELNPIENLWRTLKRNVEQRCPQNLNDLKKFLLDEWEKIKTEEIQTLVNSMNNRIQAIIHSKGNRIKY